MIEAFKPLKFQYPWRGYQARVLSELESHLSNNHIHIVAAPGAGKTILGLEIMRRLGRPTLIISPTLTIKHQWAERLQTLFLDPPQKNTPWISTQIKSPKTLTVSTYQALHCLYRNIPNPEDKEEEKSEENLEDKANEKSQEKNPFETLIQNLKTLQVKTLIFDEAHHLRKEWWKALTELKTQLPKATVIALTATPPYDVDPKEWEKYEELCGPIDAEISVPELVKTKDLCPHQDFLYLSLPSKEETAQIKTLNASIKNFLTRLQKNQPIAQNLSLHPWITDPETHSEEILNNTEFFSSIVIFLHSIGVDVNTKTYKVLGTKPQNTPKLNTKWVEALLNGLLYTNHEAFPLLHPFLIPIKKELHQIGVIENKKVVLENSKEIQTLLSKSLAKLESITEIATHEYENLKETLRLVILSDFIRSNLSQKSNQKSARKLGVIPIFEELLENGPKNAKIGVLTGSIIILPNACLNPLQTHFDKEELGKAFKTSLYLHNENYILIKPTTQGNKKIVHAVTSLFTKGHIEILVGTQALLGEGWDAPAINSLILASNVGSYMLSNQMRGRAIRTNPKDPNKISNIWHLATLNIQTLRDFFTLENQKNSTSENPKPNHFTPFDEIQANVGSDILQIIRRFQAFEAPSHQYPLVIENGFQRLHLSKSIETIANESKKTLNSYSKNEIQGLNRNTLARAKNREKTARDWEKSLQGKNSKMQPQLASNTGPTTFVFSTTLKYALLSTLSTLTLFTGQAARARENPLQILLILGGLGLFFTLPKLVKIGWLWIKHGSLENSISAVGNALLESLCERRQIQTLSRHLKVVTKNTENGIVYTRLEGATRPEEALFLRALEETLGPVENPRYLLIRSDMRYHFTQKDYHPIPKILGQEKQSAELFCENWNKHVGKAQLIYTKTPDGRKALLQARTQSLSSNFIKKRKILSQWV